MALSLNSLLKNIDEKVSRLSSSRDQLSQRISILEKENEDLRLELDQTKKKLDKALTDVEFLTVSHRLADSPDSLVATRRKIARLIRHIDNCIAMLKDD